MEALLYECKFSKQRLLFNEYIENMEEKLIDLILTQEAVQCIITSLKNEKMICVAYPLTLGNSIKIKKIDTIINYLESKLSE